jgi:hypothetical protein
VLVNPATPTAYEPTLRSVQEAALTLALQIEILDASTDREIDAGYP